MFVVVVLEPLRGRGLQHYEISEIYKRKRSSLPAEPIGTRAAADDDEAGKWLLEGACRTDYADGYTFNTDGSCLYMTIAALFVAQATNTPLTLTQQLSIFAVALLTSKGASGVQGASFIALVGTLMVVPTIPVAGMALILGIDRFMSMFRAAVNVIGNGVGTIVSPLGT